MSIEMFINEHMSICVDCAKFRNCEYKSEHKTFCNRYEIDRDM